MKGIVALFVLGVVASALVGATVAAKLDGHDGPGQRFDFVDRLRSQRTSMARSLGELATFLCIVSAALPPVVFIVWLVGMAGLRPQIWPGNERLFEWFQAEGDVSWLTSVSEFVTKTAEWGPIVVIAGTGAIVLALMASNTRWLPLFLILSALVAERYVQKVITGLVNEPFPPTGLGTYPSGGAARVICVYGFILFLFLQLRPGVPRGRRIALWSAIAVWAFMVGYARAYLLLHWPIDIPGGWLFGVLLLVTFVAATNAFERVFPTPMAE
jgi:undecaprenyl-diphosphatase